MTARLPAETDFGFLTGGGEMGALLRNVDWASTSLGPPNGWPRSLKMAIRIMLTSRQPIWVGWGEELIFFYNDAYKSIIGGRHPDALGRPTSEVWREIWPEIGPMLATAMGGVEGTYVEEQLLIMERNGYPEETYYTFSYSPIPDDDGKAGGIICANTDDTKRVIGERQIALLKELAAHTTDVRSWQEVCAQGAVALTTNGKDIPFAMIYMAEPDLHTLTLLAATGISCHEAAPGALSAKEPIWPLEEVFRTNVECLEVELAGPAYADLPTGAWDTVPKRAALLQITPAGETGRSGILIVGLSPFRLFDENYRSFLDLVVRQISAAIANADAYEQERHRAEALAELDRAKTVFFSNISHEFRTPLTLLLGPLEDSLTAVADLHPTHRERIQIAHRNGMRLLKLVNSLLDFSRIEAGRTQAVFEPTDLSAFTAGLASNFRSATEKAGLSLKIECAPLSVAAYVDRDMWEKIVLNLLSNAFKFTFEGEIFVGLQEEDNSAVLTVRDTGTGIAESELPHLFERFRRIEGARGRSFEGSGIGLALVQELVGIHQGRISARSLEDSGSTFTVTIPLGKSHLPADHIRDNQGASSTPIRVQAFVEEALRWLPDDNVTKGEIIPDLPLAADRSDGMAKAHILLADDNADMRGYIARLLSDRHECETVSNGEEALALIRQRRPDLVLTDIMMPRLDGFGLIKAIRQDAQLQDLPIIVLSARAGEDASIRGFSAGADDYLSKPFSARELIARVDGALALAKMRRTMNDALQEEAAALETLNEVGITVAGELDLNNAVQAVTDAATRLTGAAFGSFFYNVIDEQGESYMLYTLSGVSREAFAKFPMPRNTAVFGPTFRGEAVIRSDDILKDPRYGKNDPHYGMPKGHLPVRSYLAASVVSRSGEVLGGLFFGHPQTEIFTERAERLVVGIAAQAAIAIDNARLYQASQSYGQRLEREVRERTAELETANEQLRAQASERERMELILRQAQKMEAVGKLTGGVAHDFNNLLQVIGGSLQLLTKDVAGNEKAEQRLRNAIGGVSRGSKLASQLLAFGRRQPLAPKVVNLGRFIRGMDDLLRRALGDGIEIETVISGGLWNSLVDPTQVENALLNLAINARDAMNGLGKLTIEAGNAMLDDDYASQHTGLKTGQYVMLAVTDTGCGMTPDVMEQVFEPFFTTKPEGEGTGLGLSMVYGFVKQSGGHVKIYSEPDQGTTIRVYLPRIRQAEDVTTEVELGPAVGGSETVLVVEDDEDVRDTVVDLLSDLGYRVLRAKDAQGALAIIESGVAIDLLFTDVVMPGPLRSPELARKTRERLPSIAVLFTSGYTDNAIVHGGKLDEGIELLSKPYTREALARKIRHVLNRQPQQSRLKGCGVRASSLPSSRVSVGSNGEAFTILLVEDDDLIRLATADMLGELGHTIFEACDAKEALEILGRETIDVLLTDDRLPGMSGRELAIEVRRLRPSTGVIFACGTSIVSEVSAHEALTGAIQLLKPYDGEGLKAALEASAAYMSAMDPRDI